MEHQLDVRGLECPQPVILTKKELEKEDVTTVVTIVDNEVARDNVVRFAKNLNYEVEVEQKDNDYYIRICKGQGTELETGLQANPETVFIVLGDKLGRGDDELGSILMRSFFYSLSESEGRPGTLIFMNSGVKLVTEGSPVLTELMAVEKKGTEILACGTCLDYYKLKEKLCVGSVTNMYAIVEKMNAAAKVVTL